MTAAADIRHALRSHLDAELATQTEHAVWSKIRVIWSQPHDITSVWVDLGGTLQQMGPREIIEAKAARELRIKRAITEPLRCGWSPDICRQMDLRIAEKRLAKPGEVLELLLTGGQRPGKTEECARRVLCNFLYTEKSWCWGLHQTDETSRTIQQKRLMDLLPPELNPDSGKMKKDRNTKFTWTAGTGFTGAQLILNWTCRDESGREFIGGGEFGFKFYKQDFGTFQGSELTCAWSDELIPLTIAKVVVARLATRAADTAKPAFLARIRLAKEMLERGETLPAPLLGALYHGVHLISFTPADGWTSTVGYFLTNAEKYGWEISPDLEGVAGVTDPRVPRFAQPVDQNKLVCYMFTSDNRIKPAYPALRASLRNASERDKRIFLHGDVDQDWQTRFSGFSRARHMKTWNDVGAEGTIYEVIDPAGAKPWVICHYLADVAGRHWKLQEWPCRHIPIDGAAPGPWAVLSESDRRNGDPGPAQKLRLNWTRAHYIRLIWQLRQRLATKLRALHGDKLKVEALTKKLEWEERPEWTVEGEFVHPRRSLMDSRFSAVRTELKGVSMTMLEAMMKEQNCPRMFPAPGDPLHDGDQFIEQALAADILGMPGFMILDECENSLFTLATYCIPEHRDDTKASDEACKDYRDPDAYYLNSSPRHSEPVPDGEPGGWGGY